MQKRLLNCVRSCLGLVSTDNVYAFDRLVADLIRRERRNCQRPTDAPDSELAGASFPVSRADGFGPYWRLARVRPQRLGSFTGSSHAGDFLFGRWNGNGGREVARLDRSLGGSAATG